jgi:hypothetical protein
MAPSRVSTPCKTPAARRHRFTGFNFVVGGFVWEFGQIIAFKKVIDLDTGRGAFHGQLGLEWRRLRWR